MKDISDTRPSSAHTAAPCADPTTGSPGRQPNRPAGRSLTWLARAVLLALAVFMALASTGCRGVVNASPGLRWWLFSNFGASHICPEMLKRGMPLRLQDRSATVGRFWPNQCSVDINGDTQTMTVNFSGTGYAYHTLTRRIGFSCVASVEYRPDFYMGEDDIYVWGKATRIVNGPSFRLGYVENPFADAATAMTPLGMVANLFGNQIAAGELTKGFTVVRNDDTGDDFALGILMPPQKPRHAFDIEGTELLTYANETTEIRANQRDYLGPFEVADTDQAILMKFYLQGSAVDVMVVDKRTGDMWREAYQTGQRLGPPPGPVVAGGPLQPGELRVSYRLAPGQYYVVIDNTSAAGTVNPPMVPPAPLPEPVAQVMYVAQLADIN